MIVRICPNYRDEKFNTDEALNVASLARILGSSPRPFGQFVVRIVLVIAALTMGVGERPAAAQSVKLWGSSRTLDYDGNECAGQSTNACRSLISDRITVADPGPEFVTLECPRRYYLVGWDTQQSEFLRVTVVSTQPEERLRARSLTVSIVNDAAADGQDLAGDFQLYIGCSRRPWHRTPFASERAGLPSNGILDSASQAGSSNGDQ